MKRLSASTAALLLTTTASAIDICVTPNTPIPDNGAEIAIPIFFIASDSENVSSINLEIIMTHDWVGDLLIKLRSPNGITITLLDQPGIPSAGFPGPFGCGGQDISCIFTDSAINQAETICSTTLTPVIAGPVIPAMPMDTFLAQPAAGLWQVLITDQSPYDTGTLLQACLSITTNIACPADITADGTLDFFDISAFLTAFSNNDPIADFTADGSFDFFDISAFLAEFSAGCP